MGAILKMTILKQNVTQDAATANHEHDDGNLFLRMNIPSNGVYSSAECTKSHDDALMT